MTNQILDLLGFENPSNLAFASHRLIRAAVADRIGLVVVDMGGDVLAHSAIHEAVRRGRISDLRVLDLKRPGKGGGPGGEILRSLPRDLEASEGPSADGVRARSIPPLDPDDLSNPGAILVVRGEIASRALAARLVETAIAKARGAGLPPPVVIGAFCFGLFDAGRHGYLGASSTTCSIDVHPETVPAIRIPGDARPTAAKEAPLASDGFLRLGEGAYRVMVGHVAGHAFGLGFYGEDSWARVTLEPHPGEWGKSEARRLAGWLLDGGQGKRRLRDGSAPREGSSSARALLRLADGEAGEALVRAASDFGDLPLQAACEACPNGPMAWAWVRCAATPGIRERRRQFALAWPLLAHLGLEPAVGGAVDAARSPYDALAAETGLTRPTLRRLVGIAAMPRFAAWEEPHRESWVPYAAFLESLGPDRVPSTPGEWSDLCACVDAAVLALERPPGGTALTPELARDVLLPLGRSWAARREAVEAIPRTALGDAADMVAAFARFVAHATEGDRAEARLAAMRILCGHGSLSRIVAASRRWHAHPVLSAASATDVPSGLAWDRPFGPVDLGEGWSALPLASAEELREEGARDAGKDGREGLGHCVAGYALACWEGRSLIVGLRRDLDGVPRRSSTAEFHPRGDGGFRIGRRTFALGQHRGAGNARPTDAASAALARLCSAIAEGRVATARDAVPPRTYRGPSSDIAARDLAELWRPILPAAWDLPPESLLDALRAEAAPLALTPRPA